MSVDIKRVPTGIESEKVGRQEVAIFGKTATNFGKERLCSLKGSNLPQNFPKMENYQRQKSPKVAKTSQSCAKVALHGKNCAVV